MPSQNQTQVSPFPIQRHLIHHDRSQLSSSPDNGSRTRQNRQRDIKSRPRQDRNSRPNEDIRFNTGAPRSSRPGYRSARRSGRSDRAREEWGYQDAVPDYPPPSYTPATSIYPSTATLVPLQQTNPDDALSISSLQVPPSPPCVNEAPAITQSIRDCDTESTYSMEMVDNLTNLQGLGSDVDMSSNPEHEFRKPDTSRGRPILDIEPSDGSLSGSSTTRERRHTSLSPLRTLFNHFSPRAHDRPLSAHPSPNGSPYCHSNFLRSTTSLKLTRSTPSVLSYARGENSLCRKILSLKAHEKADELTSESWDSWEVLPDSSTIPLDPGPELSSHPTQASEFGHLKDFNRLDAKQETAQPSLVSVSPTPVSPVHPLSLRDRKVPTIPYIKKPVARRVESSPVSKTDHSTPLGPVLTKVRTRKVITPPPAQQETLALKGKNIDQQNSTILGDLCTSPKTQQVLSTSSPMSPIEEMRLGQEKIFNAVASNTIKGTPSSLNSSLISPDTQHDLLSLIPFHSFHGQTESSYLTEPGSPHVHSRQHYPGRPLPQAPSELKVVDSVYESRRLDSPASLHDTNFEGCLIDLDDTPLTRQPISSGDFEEEHSPELLSCARISDASSNSSVEFIESPIDCDIPFLNAPTLAAQPAKTVLVTRTTKTMGGITASTSGTRRFSETASLNIPVSRLGGTPTAARACAIRSTALVR